MDKDTGPGQRKTPRREYLKVFIAGAAYGALEMLTLVYCVTPGGSAIAISILFANSYGMSPPRTLTRQLARHLEELDPGRKAGAGAGCAAANLSDVR